MKTVAAFITAMMISGPAAWANDEIPAREATQANIADSSLRAQVAKTEQASDNKPAAMTEKKEQTSSPVLTLLKIHGI